jgi:Hypothetical glycosyl hydrolase family 15
VRAAVGPDFIVDGNSGNSTTFAPWANGQSFENGTNTSNGWVNDKQIALFQQWDANHFGTLWSMQQSQAGNSGQSNWKFFRHNLAAALMTNSYFGHGCGAGECNYTSLWWYDEYSVDLATGQATGDASRKGYLGQPEGVAQRLSNGVWRRDFENGIALLNMTSSAQTVALGGRFRRIRGRQDPVTNNGATVTSVTLSGQDAIVLLR